MSLLVCDFPVILGHRLWLFSSFVLVALQGFPCRYYTVSTYRDQCRFQPLVSFRHCKYLLLVHYLSMNFLQCLSMNRNP